MICRWRRRRSTAISCTTCRASDLLPLIVIFLRAKSPLPSRKRASYTSDVMPEPSFLPTAYFCLSERSTMASRRRSYSWKNAAFDASPIGTHRLSADPIAEIRASGFIKR